MKRYFWISIILLASVQCQAQWKATVTWGKHVYAFGAHDSTAFFMSTTSIPSDLHQLWRLVPVAGWSYADNGIDFTQGNVTSFASLGSFFFVGLTHSDGSNGPVSISTDNGSNWEDAQIGGPIASNGKYLFSESGYYTGKNIIYFVARSRDAGQTWDSLIDIAPAAIITNGTCVFVNTGSTLWRSTDTGNTWSQLSPTFVGVMTTMDSLLFITAGGNVIKSTDSGGTWSTVMVDSAGMPVKVNLLVASKGNLFAGTATGVLMSTDSGHTWRAENVGLTRSVAVYAMGVFDTLLFVANNPGDSVFYRSIPEMTSKEGVAERLPPGDSIEIYPNPTFSQVSIRSGGTSILGVEVLNVLGETILTQPLPKGEEHAVLDLSKLPSGTYFVEIQTANGTVLRKIVRE